MKKILIALVGPINSGKTALTHAVCAQLPLLEPVRSFTTRERRGPEDDAIYDFLTRDEFVCLRDAGKLVHSAEAYGNIYGNLASHFDDVFARGHMGILALVEAGVEHIRAAGYEVKVVEVQPLRNSARRNRDETTRGSAISLVADFVLINDFEYNGFFFAVEHLIDYIETIQ